MDAIKFIDKEYVLNIRHELHMYPEVGFDLPKTTALIRRELDAMGIPYVETYGESSIEKTAEAFGIPATAKLPINRKLAAACDEGMIELFEGDWLDELFSKIC